MPVVCVLQIFTVLDVYRSPLVGPILKYLFQYWALLSLFPFFTGAPFLAPEVRHKGNSVPENRVLKWPVNFTVVWRFMLGARELVHIFVCKGKSAVITQKLVGAPYKFYIYKQTCLSVTFPNITPHMLSSSAFFGAHVVKFVHLVEIWAILGDNRCSLSLPITWKFYLPDISLQWKLPTHAVVFVLCQLTY
jgi:hypothetical protein